MRYSRKTCSWVTQLHKNLDMYWVFKDVTVKVLVFWCQAHIMILLQQENIQYEIVKLSQQLNGKSNSIAKHWDWNSSRNLLLVWLTTSLQLCPLMIKHPSLPYLVFRFSCKITYVFYDRMHITVFNIHITK